MMPSLHDAQRNFIATINDGPDALDPTLFHGAPDRILLGLKAHANTISHARLVAIEQSFPMAHGEMGAAVFNRLSRVYIEQPAVRRLDLNAIGEIFPGFLQQQDVASELVDLAAIEWASLESFHAADAEPLRLDHLSKLSQAELLSFQLGLHPATRCVKLNAPVAAPLTHLDLGDEETAAVLISRPAAEVQMLGISGIMLQLVEEFRHSAVAVRNLLAMTSEQQHEADPIGPVLALIKAGALIAAE